MAETVIALSSFISSLSLRAKMPFFVGNFVSSIQTVVPAASSCCSGAFLLQFHRCRYSHKIVVSKIPKTATTSRVISFCHVTWEGPYSFRTIISVPGIFYNGNSAGAKDTSVIFKDHRIQVCNRGDSCGFSWHQFTLKSGCWCPQRSFWLKEWSNIRHHLAGGGCALICRQNPGCFQLVLKGPHDRIPKW